METLSFFDSTHSEKLRGITTPYTVSGPIDVFLNSALKVERMICIRCVCESFGFSLRVSSRDSISCWQESPLMRDVMLGSALPLKFRKSTVLTAITISLFGTQAFISLV